MPGSERWVKIVSWCAVLLSTSVIARAQIPQPVEAPAPAAPEFLSRYDFHLAAASLVNDNPDYAWDTHFGGSFDVVDYVYGRAGVLVDYQAGLGNEPRIFDPNQGNYTLEPSLSIRAPGAEFVAFFHHMSRHLGDRPKDFAHAWNELGARVLHRIGAGKGTIDLEAEAGSVIQHSYVDYRWMAQLGVTARTRSHERLGLFLQANGQLIGVDYAVNQRGTQFGGIAEAGVRVRGAAGGYMELFAGVERRVDPWPVGVGVMQWGLAGLRLVSR